MKFKIIPNQQTPKINPYGYDLFPELIIGNNKLHVKFLSFASRQFNCVGLAANQVKLDGIRLIENFFAIKINNFWDIIINPVILEYYGKKEIKKETCLTWLGKIIEAERYPTISVEYYNLKGEFKNKIVTGFEAQIWQHEYNHLIGIEEKFINKEGII